MYHSLNFKMLPAKGSGSMSFNTYKDFLLVPTSLPIIAAPGVKTKSIEVPGANGAIDLTESLTPYPVYNNRSGSLKFALLMDRLEYYNRYKNAPHSVKDTYAFDSKGATQAIYSDLMNKLHGHRCQITLEDDPEWYYEGRIGVGEWKPSTDGKWPLITLNYDLAPYKLSVYNSIYGATETGTDRWRWDPFSFVDGVIYSSMDPPSGFTADGFWKNITVDTNDYTVYGIVVGNDAGIYRSLTGWMPVSPSITVSANATNMGIKITNSELGYTYTKEYPTETSAKTYTDPECLLYDYTGDGYHIYLKGHGTFTINFRKGSL